METSALAPVLSITDRAVHQIVALLAAEESDDELALQIEITGVRGTEFTYDLVFESLENAADDDAIYRQGDLVVLVPAGSIPMLKGATLDLPSVGVEEGLVLRNPNKPNPLADVNLTLTGELAERVGQLITMVVNPALESHAGYVELAGVEDDRVYLTMGGGCHGCAASALTLKTGIERMIVDHIPEITKVIDVTDHATGATPYY